MGRPRKYHDQAHAKLREKVARYRARHKAELQLDYVQSALERGREKKGTAEQWRLCERIEPRGTRGDVLKLRIGEPVPIGYAQSPWLPHAAISWRLACLLATTRREQIREQVTRQSLVTRLHNL
jgi:hypothetical protein